VNDGRHQREGTDRKGDEHSELRGTYTVIGDERQDGADGGQGRPKVGRHQENSEEQQAAAQSVRGMAQRSPFLRELDGESGEFEAPLKSGAESWRKRIDHAA
jgi:hypothetical protein